MERKESNNWIILVVEEIMMWGILFSNQTPPMLTANQERKKHQSPSTHLIKRIVPNRQRIPDPEQAIEHILLYWPTCILLELMQRHHYSYASTAASYHPFRAFFKHPITTYRTDSLRLRDHDEYTRQTEQDIWNNGETNKTNKVIIERETI
uniref:Uncharacterized protein n=1 Tax=Rhizophora mucronata TaxID=61149 RepID=A0A2P2Q8K0_RHIMU